MEYYSVLKKERGKRAIKPWKHTEESDMHITKCLKEAVHALRLLVCDVLGRSSGYQRLERRRDE